jgi:hypothetical protein
VPAGSTVTRFDQSLRAKSRPSSLKVTRMALRIQDE